MSDPHKSVLDSPGAPIPVEIFTPPSDASKTLYSLRLEVSLARNTRALVDEEGLVGLVRLMYVDQPMCQDMGFLVDYQGTPLILTVKVGTGVWIGFFCWDFYFSVYVGVCRACLCLCVHNRGQRCCLCACSLSTSNIAIIATMLVSITFVVPCTSAIIPNTAIAANRVCKCLILLPPARAAQEPSPSTPRWLCWGGTRWWKYSPISNRSCWSSRSTNLPTAGTRSSTLTGSSQTWASEAWTPSSPGTSPLGDGGDEGGGEGKEEEEEEEQGINHGDDHNHTTAYACVRPICRYIV